MPSTSEELQVSANRQLEAEGTVGFLFQICLVIKYSLPSLHQQQWGVGGGRAFPNNCYSPFSSVGEMMGCTTRFSVLTCLLFFGGVMTSWSEWNQDQSPVSLCRRRQRRSHSFANLQKTRWYRASGVRKGFPYPRTSCGASRLVRMRSTMFMLLLSLLLSIPPPLH